jgi:hypothetical protein
MIAADGHKRMNVKVSLFYFLSVYLLLSKIKRVPEVLVQKTKEIKKRGGIENVKVNVVCFVLLVL